jgi:hypothetical protein
MERSRTEWAEVQTIRPDTDVYEDQEYGYVETGRTVVVDGKKAGAVSITLVPRRNTSIFHEICDAASDELREMGCLFCDTRGRPRLASVKEAMKNNDTKGWFLYINTFELEPDYRTSTWVGAMALRSLLTDRHLATSWSLAAYIPTGTTHFSQEESTKHDIVNRKRRRSARGRNRSLVRDPAEIQDEEEGVRHLNELKKQDMRQFLRAGFHQAKETVFDGGWYHVFCVPTFLENPIMSHEEALSIEIAEKKPPVKKPTGISQELLQFMISSCSKRRELTASLRGLTKPLRERYEFRETFEGLDQQRSEMQQLIQACDASEERRRRAIEERDAAFALIAEPTGDLDQQTREQFDSVDSVLAEGHPDNRQMRDLRNLAEQVLNGMQEMEEKIQREVTATKEKFEKGVKELDSQVRAGISRYVTDEEGTVVMQSNALHACACNLEPSYVEMLLERVPDSRKVQAINSFDPNGYTPLMTAAASSHFEDPEDRYQMCENLIHLNANKNLTGDGGRTALGHFRHTEQSLIDFSDAMSLPLRGPGEIEMSRRMETLLMPLMGPTPADAAEVDDPPSSEDDEDEMSDDSLDDEDESIGDDADHENNAD